jgi:hypothetical protein
MKKLLVILVLLAYSFSSFGVNLHLHNCCGKFESLSFSSRVNTNCTGNKSHLFSKPCCEDKDVLLKLSTEQEVPKIFYLHFDGHAIRPIAVIVAQTISYRSQIVQLSNQPATGSPPIFILNCVYRI